MIAPRILVCAAALVFIHSVSAQDRAVLVPLFGPETFVHDSGSPHATLQFNLKPLVRGPYTMTVNENGQGNARVELNGTQIFGPGSARSLTGTVALNAANTLDIKMDDAAGSSLTVGVYGYQYEYAEDYTNIALAPLGVAGASTLDWRVKGAVTPVKNQGQGPYDWAFSVTGAVEGGEAIKHGVLKSLSEQQLVDCSGTSGSLPVALRYLIAYGADTESSYPYTAQPGACKYTAPALQPTNLLRSPAGGESALPAMLDLQPVSVALDGSWFATYTGGITTPDCGAQVPQFRAVLIVGSDTDLATGTSYWLVKNSLGTSWGEARYFRIVRGQNACGIADYAMLPVV